MVDVFCEFAGRLLTHLVSTARDLKVVMCVCVCASEHSEGAKEEKKTCRERVFARQEESPGR